MDWGVVALLAAITWLDGVRRVPADALVLRRVLGGPWTVADRSDGDRTWRLLSWWSPLQLALILPGASPAAKAPLSESADDALAARLARSRAAVLALRWLGMLLLGAIVFGVPAAVARAGTWGFLVAATVVLLLSVGMAVVTFRAVIELTRGRRRAARVAVPLLWPFSAPRAAEVVLEHAVEGAAPVVVARRLLGPARFAEWVRPQAYDALSAGRALRRTGETLLALVGRSDLAAIVQARPAGCGSGESYCVRCARVYRAGTAVCADCGGVPLSASTAV